MNTQSEQINELMAALAKAQGQLKPAVKDSSNPHFKSRYADLASVWEACREPLSANGLAVTQTVISQEDSQFLVTTLGHVSGQWMKSFMKLPLQRPGPQELGSCLSYCRRYSLASMVGVFQDDDDGEKAQVSYRNLTQSQVDDIRDEIQGDIELEQKICKAYSVKALEEIPSQNFQNIMTRLKYGAKSSEKASA
jgi:hypothetical protein